MQRIQIRTRVLRPTEWLCRARHGAAHVPLLSLSLSPTTPDTVGSSDYRQETLGSDKQRAFSLLTQLSRDKSGSQPGLPNSDSRAWDHLDDFCFPFSREEKNNKTTC